MANYRFYDIFEPGEFQDFARDIVQVRENIKLENFGNGRDGGMDGRYISREGNITVLQVKRHKAYSKASLESELKKVKRINPDRYILVLSVNEEPGTKDRIKKIFQPYIKDVADIILNGDLNDYLSDVAGKYRAVERKYYKLWLGSTAMLEEILEDVRDTKIYQRSEEFLKQATQEREYFVKTGLYEEAIMKLKRKQVILISGEPGMGKTTLAKQLALYYLEQSRTDTEFHAKFYWVESVDDLSTVLYKRKDEKSRIIIFDDFWGDIFYEEKERGKNERELGRLIEKIRKEKKDYFILTTRHYILEQGLKRHEDIRKIIESNKLECRLVQYSLTERQEIYYQHIRKADMNYDQMQKLFDAGDWIIESKNYNLRVIDMFVNQVRDEDKPEDLPHELDRFLDEPEEFWDKIFQNLSIEAKYLYKVLRTMPKFSQSQFVEKVYSHGMKLYDRNMQWKEYAKVIAELEKTIIRTDSTSSGQIVIQFQNPSIKHMIERYLMKNLEQNKELLLNSCMYFVQNINLLRMLDFHKKYDEYYVEVMGKALEMIDKEDIDIIRQQHDKKYTEKQESFDERKRLLRQSDIYKHYKVGICSRWNKEYGKFLNLFMDLGMKFSHDLSYYLIDEFPSFIIHALKENILHDIAQILDTYKELIIRNGMDLDYEEFMNYDKKSCLEHIKRNRSEIEEYLYKWYDYRYCMEVADSNWEEASNYATFYDIKCDELGISTREAFWDNVKTYESWMEKELEEQLDEREEKFRESRANFKEVKEEYWKKYFSFDEDEENEEFINSPKYEDYINKLLKNFDILDGSMEQFADSLAMLGCTYFENSEKIWKKSDFEELCLDELCMNEKQLEILLETGSVRQKEKWIRIVNSDIFFAVFLYLFYYSNERNRENDYQRLLREKQKEAEDLCIKLGHCIYQYEPYQLLGAMMKLDKDNFKTYVAVPCAKEFYEENYDIDQQRLIQNLLNSLDYTVCIDEGNSTGYICSGYDILDIIEQDKEFYVSDMIPEKFTKEQVESFLKAGILKDSDQLNLQQMYDQSLIERTDIEQHLLELWNIILEYIGECENGQ